jgi:hypothetical protein
MADQGEKREERGMPQVSLSEKYALASAVALLALALLNVPAITLGVALLGLAVGGVVARQTSLRRAGLVAIAGFAAAIAISLAMLIRI